MKSVQLEIGQVPEPQEDEVELEVFKIFLGGQGHAYADLCPKCEKTLTRIFKDAGPIKRSHNNETEVDSGAESGGAETTEEPEGGNGTKGRTRMGAPKPPTRPEVPK